MFTFERRLKSTAAQREIMPEAHMERCIISQKRQVFLIRALNILKMKAEKENSECILLLYETKKTFDKVNFHFQ